MKKLLTRVEVAVIRCRELITRLWRSSGKLVNALNKEEPSARFWSKAHLILLAVIVGFQILLSAIGLHGFSLAIWHDLIDGSARDEVLFGEPQVIRGDDWGVTIPKILAQTRVEPRFPRINPIIGQGQHMATLHPAPVWGVVLAFRPAAWGFIIGSDFGLAWMWWSRVLGLVYAVFLVLFCISNRRFWLSLLASLAFLWSPFVQFWSLNCADVYIYGLLSLAAFIGLMSAANSRAVIAASVALGWAMTAYAVTMYPPYQISNSFVLLSVAIAWLFARRKDTNWVGVALGSVLAIIVAATFVFAYFVDAQPVFETMAQTIYPGLRTSHGGQMTVLQLLDNHTIIPFKVEEWSPFQNICESAKFYYLFPLTIALFIFHVRTRRALVRLPLFWALLISTTLLVSWSLTDFPEWLARGLMLNRVPPVRSQAGLGLANILWLVLTLSVAANTESRVITRQSLPVIALGGLIWSVLLGCSLAQSPSLVGLSLKLRVVSVVSWVALGICFLARLRVFLLGYFLLSLTMTHQFNPVVIKGVDFLIENPLSAKVRELSRQKPEAKWAVFDPFILPNLLRAAGVHTINGTHYYPQHSIWRVFDPDGSHMDTYNRYGHTILKIGRPKQVELTSPYPDTFQLTIDPTHLGFKKLGADYFIVTGDPGPLAESPEFRRVFEYGDRSIFVRLKNSGTRIRDDKSSSQDSRLKD